MTAVLQAKDGLRDLSLRARSEARRDCWSLITAKVLVGNLQQVLALIQKFHRELL
jgi:hypothetical protein